MMGVDGMLPKVTFEQPNNLTKDLTQSGLNDVVFTPEDALRLSKCV